MNRIFLKNFYLISTLVISSCALPKNYNAEKKTELRIVDLQGKPHNVKMRMPELNAQALAAQGNLSEEKLATIPRKNYEPEISKNKYAANTYPGASSEAIKQTLQTPENPDIAANQAGVAQGVQPELSAEGNVNKNKEQIIEYDLSNEPSRNKAPTAIKNIPTTTANNNSIFIQTGSFAVLGHAKNSLAQIKNVVKKDAATKITEAQINKKKVYRVLVGPFKNKAEASRILTKLDRSGHKAIIIKD